MSTTLATCPIEVKGNWHAPAEAAQAVITRARDVSLAGITLRAHPQPERLLVENKLSGYPSIWLHDTPADMAWIMVVTAPAAWCQLAYQFGHECGHVLANSWQRNAAPRTPCQWLEETLVEAFSIRGLGLLAESWEKDPPFAGSNSYSEAIRSYRRDLLAKSRRFAEEQGATDLLQWFAKDEPRLDKERGLGPLEHAAVPVILGLIEPEPVLIEDYNGLNRWPERTALPLPEYLHKWRDSCREIGAPARLPVVLGDLLGVSAPG